MPMDFPDMSSLRAAAKVWNFRERDKGETEAHYREALADFVEDKDKIESFEIRTGKGWDKWTEEENRQHLRRIGFPV